MIYIYQDASKVSADWLARVADLQGELERCETREARRALVDSRQGVWAQLKDTLLEMSSGKCWYSEAPDAVSDWHVDHFRPKTRALDEDRTVHDGYAWLAFDWRNYRIAGSYPNSPHRDGSGNTRGKWDYFPLGPGSRRATWENRDTSGEVVLLLDPTKKSDPKLMTFNEDGMPIAADPANPIIQRRVDVTVRFLYLDSPRLIAARKRKWREISDWIDTYHDVCPRTIDDCTGDDYIRFARLLERLADLSGKDATFAATARACLRVNALDHLIQQVEEAP